MLLVDDDEAEGGELRPLGKKGVGTDDERGAPIRSRRARCSPLRDGGSAQHERHLNTEWGEEPFRRRGVLTGQQLCWCEEGALVSSGRRGSSGNEGDRGLPRTNIALE
jgi:hypothetical protein